MGTLPDGASKVFTGVIFDVYQWEQEMYDGSTATFERLERPDTVEVIAVTPGGKLLIQRQQQPDSDEWFLSSIGGRVDPGEEPFAAIKREMLEEMGCVSEHWEHIESWQPTSKLMWLIHIYIARGCVKTHDQDLDGGERIEMIEVSFDTFLDLIDSGELTRFAGPVREMCIRAKYDKPSYETLKKKLLGGV